MKSIKSMPAMAGPSFRPLLRPSPDERSNLKRSQSLSVNRPQERMRHIAKRVPFMAFPGVGSQLTTFARSYSRANLARMGSRTASHANLHGSGYGSMHDVVVQAMLSSPPSGKPFERESSEGALFGSIFDLEQDLEMMQPTWTLSLGLAVFTAVLASFQVGYNSGVLNVPQDVIVASLHLSTIQWSICVAIFCIGGLVGSMLGGTIADKIGRKNFLIANNVAFIGGGLLQALSSGFYMLSCGRLLIGIGCGGATVVVPMYLGEIAPANLRGSLGTMNQFSMVVGILVANLLGKPLGGDPDWRYLLGLCLLPALIQTIMAATLLESPLWLVLQGGSKHRVHAEEILSRLRGTDEVEFDMECLLAEAQAGGEDGDDDDDGGMIGDDAWNRSFHGSSNDLFGDEAGSGSGYATPKHHPSHISISSPKHQNHASASSIQQIGGEVVEKGSLLHKRAETDARAKEKEEKQSLFHPLYRRPLLIGFGLQLAQQFSGINAVFFYSTMFFQAAHMSDPWMGSVLASGVNVLATGLSIYLIERTGRRPLLLWSTGGMMLSCGGLTFALLQNLPSATGDAPPPAWVGLLSVIMVLIFVSFFEIGLGPIPWLIGSEIYPRQVRTQAMAISSTLNWLSNFAVGLSFPTLALLLGPLSFVPFGIVLAIALLLEYVYVPETQGKTLEEIQEQFEEEWDKEDREKEHRGGQQPEEEKYASNHTATPANHSNTKKNPKSILASINPDAPPSSAGGSNTKLPGASTHLSRRPSHPSASGGDVEQSTPIPEGREELDDDIGQYSSDDEPHIGVDHDSNGSDVDEGALSSSRSSSHRAEVDEHDHEADHHDANNSSRNSSVIGSVDTDYEER